jgi:hypothetical protein
MPSRPRPSTVPTAAARHRRPRLALGATILHGIAAARRWGLGLLLGAALLCGLATACAPAARAFPSSSDPLASLAAPAASPAFDLAFWVDQQTGRTTLWRQAFTYCLQHPRLPNCRTVRIATWWGTPR